MTTKRRGLTRKHGYAQPGVLGPPASSAFHPSSPTNRGGHPERAGALRCEPVVGHCPSLRLRL